MLFSGKLAIYAISLYLTYFDHLFYFFQKNCQNVSEHFNENHKFTGS